VSGSLTLRLRARSSGFRWPGRGLLRMIRSLSSSTSQARAHPARSSGFNSVLHVSSFKTRCISRICRVFEPADCSVIVNFDAALPSALCTSSSMIQSYESTADWSSMALGARNSTLAPIGLNEWWGEIGLAGGTAGAWGGYWSAGRGRKNSPAMTLGRNATNMKRGNVVQCGRDVNSLTASNMPGVHSTGICASWRDFS